MAFKERFKDKTTIVGKTGENAMLVDQPPPPKVSPAKGPTKQQMATGRTAKPMSGPPAQDTHSAMLMPSAAPSGTPQQVGMVPPMGMGMPPPANSKPTAGRRSVSPGKGKQHPAPQQTPPPATTSPQVAPLGMPPPGGMGMPPPGGAKMPPANASPSKGKAPSPKKGTAPQAPLAKGLPAKGAPLGAPPAGGPPPMGLGMPPPGGMGLPPPGGMGMGMPPPGGAPMGMGMPAPQAGKKPTGKASSPKKTQQLAPPGMAAGGPAMGMGMGMGMGMPPANDHLSGPEPVQRYDYNKAKSAEKGKRANSSSGGKPPPKFGRRAASNPPVEPERPASMPDHEPKYTPYTVDDWRKLKEKPIKRGGLGPSDTDESRFYRIMRNRAKEYADTFNRVNMAVIAAEGTVNPVPITKPVPKETVELQERRHKALEFAKHVPKPKVKEDKPLDDTHNVLHGSGDRLPPRRGGSDGTDEDAPEATAEKLAELEARHAKDQEMIESIKRQLKM